MDVISLLLLLAVLVLIASMVFLDLSVYKFHYLFAIVVMGVLIYTYGMLYQMPEPNYIDVVLKAFGSTSQILRGIFRTNDIIDRINNDVLFLVSAYAIHVIGFGYTYILIFAIFFKNLNLKMRFSLQKNLPNFLVLGDDDRVKFVLETYEQDFNEKGFGQKKLAKKINLAIPKTLLATKELKTTYSFKPGVTSFDIQNQSINQLLSKTQKDITIISLLSKDEDVLALVEKLNRFYDKNPNTQIKSYILYDNPDHLFVYESFNKQQKLIQFFSYHQIIAQQLILDHPLTSLLPESLIDFPKATLKNCKIGYHLLGFSQINQEIYKHLFITNQFPPSVSKFLGKELITYDEKPIKYRVYASEGQEFLTSFAPSFPRTVKKEFLPFPPLSATTQFIQTSLVGNQILDSLKYQKLSTEDYRCIIIAVGDDVVNLSMLQKVRDFVSQQRLTSTTKIFVQMKNRNYVQSSELFKDKNIIAFGFGDYAFSLKQIVNPVFNKIAKRIHETLHQKTQYEELPIKAKDNLLYEAITLRFKLNLMGLDLSTDQRGLGKKEFYKRYDPDGDQAINAQNLKAKNDSDLNVYKQLSKKKRNLLARQEHLRWSAYQLVQGFVPMAIAEMIDLQSYQDIANKKDARLTSFEGLFDLHQLLVSQLNYTYQEADLVYPFFHTMDHLFTILEGTPYRVVDVINRENNHTVELDLDDMTQEVISTIKD